jgi:hypothetical protein
MVRCSGDVHVFGREFGGRSPEPVNCVVVRGTIWCSARSRDEMFGVANMWRHPLLHFDMNQCVSVMSEISKLIGIKVVQSVAKIAF